MIYYVIISIMSTEQQHCQGRVKWFNNKAGYGFITVSDGPVDGDVFVHHSALTVSEEQYKYLVQGEYVEFELMRVEGGQHEWQASNVRGCNGGKLMCETRREVRTLRAAHAQSSGRGSDEEAPALVRPRPESQPRVRSSVIRVNRREDSELSQTVRRVPVRFVGQGPRGDDGGEWMLVRRTPQQQSRPQQQRPRQQRPRVQRERSNLTQE